MLSGDLLESLSLWPSPYSCMHTLSQTSKQIFKKTKKIDPTLSRGGFWITLHTSTYIWVCSQHNLRSILSRWFKFYLLNLQITKMLPIQNDYFWYIQKLPWLNYSFIPNNCGNIDIFIISHSTTNMIPSFIETKGNFSQASSLLISFNTVLIFISSLPLSKTTFLPHF